MSYFITQKDKALVNQRLIDIKIKIDVYDDMGIYIDSIECGLISGTCTIDAASDIRRTANFTLIPSKKINTLIEENSLIWINRNIIIFIGIYDMREQKYVWYQQGKYLIQSYASTYDATTNELTINCIDWMAKLDGTINGQLSAPITSFPAYKEYETTSGTSFLVDNATYSSNTYNCTIANFKSYKQGMYFIIKVPADNLAQSYVKVNGLASMPILDPITGVYVPAGTVKAGYYYSFMVTGANTVYLTNTLPLTAVREGSPINYYIIRDGVITALEKLGGIREYNVDDIGEYQAMQVYNKDYLAYRKENPLWNNIPYDLEFNVGDNVLSILTAIRDLYPNYEFFFDEKGTFIAQMIPSSDEDDVYLDNDFIQNLIISEETAIDTSTVKNVTEVFGAALDVDFMSKSCSLSEDTYTIDVDEYGDTYCNGDYVAVTFDKPNPANAKIRVHTIYTYHPDGSTKSEKKEVTLGVISILDQMTDKPLAAGTIPTGATFVLKLKTKVEDGKPVQYFYFLSQYQPQALNVLTDGSVSDENYTCSDGTVVKKYTRKYFEDYYNCRIVSLTIDRESPFSIQKLGVLLQVFSGGEFDNIESDQRALARAEYENWKSARLTDSITITTKICPFFDVNKKISYRRSDKEKTEDYLVQSVAHDLSAGTSTITMSKFRSLYNDNAALQPTHEGLERSTHETLGRFKHADLTGDLL